MLAPLNEALADTRMDDAMEEAGVKMVILRRLLIFIFLFSAQGQGSNGSLPEMGRMFAR